MSSKFSRLELLYGAEALARLRDARVIVFGIGGVGSWCVEALARCGIGHITIVDSDCVAPSNINRQLVALNSTIGIPKVDVIAQRIADINPDCICKQVNGRYTAENADTFQLNEYDVVVDAIDSLADKADLILRTCSLERPRLFSSMGAALKTDILRIDTAEFWQVKGCPLARALRQRFKRGGTFPSRKFRCVYSSERHPNFAQTSQQNDIKTTTHQPHGTVVFATSAFGLTLAQLVVNYIIESQ